MAAKPAAKKNGLHSNFDVEYVIVYRIAETDKETAAAQFEKLVRSLAEVGLATEARNGDNSSILLFVKVASESHLYEEVYRSRVKDWLHGVIPEAPDRDTGAFLKECPMTEAERLRIVYQMITNPREEGGAGVIPHEGDWKFVDSIFPLHDDAFNKSWIMNWSVSYFLSTNDLDQVRDRLGEKVAFYFAFLQSYFAFLIFPATIGFTAWFMLGEYSPLYAVINGLWCVVFVEHWKHQETEFAFRWGVHGVSSIETTRREFKHEKEVQDPVTGETVLVFPSRKRLARQLLQVPFGLLAVLLLGSLIAGVFAIEIFISEVYSGPFKNVLVYLPTVLLTVFIPMLTTTLTDFAKRLNDFENYQTTDAYEAAMTHKTFVLDFITSYMPIFLTAFVYVPFGCYIVPYLDVFGLTVVALAEDKTQVQAPTLTTFTVNPDRLKKQVIYFAMTAQIVNFATEVVVPYVKRKGFHKVKELKIKRAAKNGGADPRVAVDDQPEEAAFLARVRDEAELEEYDVMVDLREMVIQFGYLSLFSVVWPLTPISFIVNNWIELRSDAVKICFEKRRCIPWRADTIGPWLDSLGFLVWLGSVSTAALVYLFTGSGLRADGTPSDIKGWALLLSIFFSEHVYLIVRLAVRFALSQLDSPGLRKERGKRFVVRRRYLEESLGQQQVASALAPGLENEKISRDSLEESARQGSLSGANAGAEQRFWLRQPTWGETVKVGVGLIRAAAAAAAKEEKGEEGKKTQ